MNSSPKRYRNRILSSLSPSELKKISSHLTPLDLPQHKDLLNGKRSTGYFLENGIASVVVTLQEGHTVEVGVIGCDGVVGIPLLLGGETSPGRTFVQIRGSGFSIPIKVLKEQFEEPGRLRQQVQKYIQGFMVQIAQTAACNRVHTIEERLARWLLTCRDRMDSNELHLTHEFLGMMSGAPRSTVTLALRNLEQAEAINSDRGVVTIKDRAALEKLACECYATVRKEFRRLGLLSV